MFNGFTKQKPIKYLPYSSWRLYQYNEDDLLTSFFSITSLQVNKEKMLIDSLFLFLCLCVSMLFESLVKIKN